MADEEKEKIDSENDPSEEDDNTESEDEGSDESSEDTEDESADDDSEGEDDGEEDEGDKKPKFTPSEKKLYARAKKAEAELKKLKAEKPKEKPAKSESNELNVDSAVQAALDKRDLDSLDLPSEVKKEIKNYARLHKVSVQVAAKSPYIAFIKSEAEKKTKSEEAAAGTKRKTQPKTDFANMKPSDFDLSTKEGREGWAKYKQYLNSL